MTNHNTRRQFLKQTATTTAAAIGTMAISQRVYAAGSDEIRVGVIGCGGRGTGAVVNALTAEPTARLVAMGDTFTDRLEMSLKTLQSRGSVADRIEVTPEKRFIGFDAFKKVVDCGVDVVLLTTPPHFRPEHLRYAVEAGKHAFVEKPVAVDAPGVRHVQETCKMAKKKGLSIVSGLGWRYDKGVRAIMEKIQDGAIGKIVSIESTYNSGTLWHRGDKPEWSRMEYQIRNWLYYTWLSGDHICEQAVHSLDKTAWLAGDVSPLRAVGLGGRQQRTDKKYGHIYDHHTVFYEYPNGLRVYFTCCQQNNVYSHVDELVLGTKGTARILENRIDGETKWKFQGRKPNLYVLEHKALFKSIRNGEALNNGHYMCNSTMLAVMGRMCTYTGQAITWEQAINCPERLGPKEYRWGDLPEPPVAIPGVTKFIEGPA